MPQGLPSDMLATAPTGSGSLPQDMLADQAPAQTKSDQLTAAKPGAVTRAATGFGEAIGAPPKMSDYVTGPIYAAKHPVDAAKLFFGNMVSAQQDQWRRSATDAREGWINRNPDQLIAGIGEGVNAAIPLVGPAMQSISDAASSGDWAGAGGKMAGMIFNLFGPHAVEATAGKIAGPASAAKAAAEIPVAERMPSAAGITNSEVTNAAQGKGVTLTGPVQRNMRAMGERGVGGIRAVDNFNKTNTSALVGWGDDIRDGFDKKTGASDMAAGRAVRDSVEKMKETDMAAANKAYADVKIGGQPISKVIDHGDLGPVRHAIDVEQNETLATGMTKERYHSPNVQSAVDDIKGQLDKAESLVDKATGKPAIDPTTGKPVVSWSDMRSLRSNFMTKGHTYDGTVPKEARTVYQQAAGAVDGSMGDAASQHGTYVEQQWRDANKQWTELQENYNGKKSPLRRVLETHELSPDKALSEFTAPNAHELIDLAKQKGIDLGPVKARVFDNIRAKNFGTDKAGRLGGYSDSYLQALYNPEELRQIHVHGEAARQLGYDVNPSGTAKMAAALGQVSSGLGLAGGYMLGGPTEGLAGGMAGLAAPGVAAQVGTSSSLTNWGRSTPVKTTPFGPATTGTAGGLTVAGATKSEQIRKQKGQQ